MTAAWTAGSVRARLLLSRRIGRDGAARVSECRSLTAAIAVLAGTAYGEGLHPELDLRDAQHAVAATLLWHIRVLGGWLPPSGAAGMRALAGWFEIQNVDERLAALASGDHRRTFQLGGLATAWRRVATAPTVTAVRVALAASPWGDPGSDAVADIRLALRMRWLRRIQAELPEASTWARAGLALVAAREVLAGRTRTLRRALDLPKAWRSADSVAELRDLLGRDVRWALDDVDDAAALWRAETRYWERLEAAAEMALMRWAAGAECALAVVTLLAVDARRVTEALAVAYTGDRQGVPDAAP